MGEGRETHVRCAIRMLERKHHAARDLFPRAGQAAQQALEASQSEFSNLALADPLVFRRLFAIRGIDFCVSLPAP